MNGPVSIEQLKEVKIDLEEQIDDLRLMFVRIESEMKSKIDKEHFYWIIGALMTIILGIFGVIYSKLDEVGTNVNKTQVDVSFIQGKINSAEVTR